MRYEEAERQIALESDSLVSKKDNEESCIVEGSCAQKRKAEKNAELKRNRHCFSSSSFPLS